MPIEEYEEQLLKIVAQLSSNRDLREDLMQEGRIHLWREQEHKPGQTMSWYLQNCRFHLLHYLAKGCSVDSPKRRAAQVQVTEPDSDLDTGIDRVPSGNPVLEAVSARDLFFSLSFLLSGQQVQILRLRVQGFGTGEIANLLGISRPTLLKQRRKIASSAERLSITC